MFKLSKISSPGWIKEFETEADAKQELYQYICSDCRKEYKLSEDSSIEDMLWSSCGCEFLCDDKDWDDEL